MAIKIPKDASEISLSLLFPEDDKFTVSFLEYNVNSVSFLIPELKVAPSKTYRACLLPTPTFNKVTKNVPSPPTLPRAAPTPESIGVAAQKNLKSTLCENPGL